MAKKYTTGYHASMFSDWLKPYMMAYQRRQEEADYKAPLGERNWGVVNAVLAGAKTVKAINDFMEMRRESEIMALGGPIKKYQYGGILGEEINVTAPRREGMSPLDIRRQPKEDLLSGLQKVETPEIKEMSKLEALGLKADKLESGLSEGLGALGAVQTLRDRDVGKTQKVATTTKLGIKAAEQIAKKIGTEAAKEGVKKVAAKVMPGLGVATGLEKMAHGETAAAKTAGAVEAVSSVIPIPGASGVGSVIASGIEILEAGKPKKQRHIARWG